ncbi:MAG: S41 family peptidase [Planctomycetota bacterium]
MRAAVLLLALAAGGVAIAGDGDGKKIPRSRSTDPPAPISTRTWRNATLETTKRVVEEVIEKVRALHVDGDALSVDKMREDAIEAFREHAAARSFRLLEGDARDLFRRALQHVRDGDLDDCFQVIDQHLVLRTHEQASSVCDVLVRGAISTTNDPFTYVIDERAVERLAASMSGKRPAGFGIKIAESEFGAFTIDHVSRGYDAFEKGVQDGDTIVELDGHPTVLSSREEVLRRLQGGTKVRLRIWREGFATGHDVEIEARVPSGPNVSGGLLPGGIGYVRIDSFNEPTASALEAVLRRLDRQGLRAVVIDVRDNPGGSMASCAAVAGLFLGPGKTVCKITRRESGVVTSTLCTTDSEAVISTRTPLVVLTNRGSASASEMLAGALRDNSENGRVRLVGTRTYGKGVGQSPVPIMAALGEKFLLVSTMKYRTPKDLSPEKDGLQADHQAPRFAYSPAEQEELLRLHAEGAFDRYLVDHSVQDESILLALATDDEGVLERYPGWAAWQKSVATTLRPEVLRRALRAAIRSWAVKTKDRVFREDLEDDVPLRRAYDMLSAELPRPAPTPKKYF